MRWLPTGGSGGSGTPATTVTGPDAFGAAPVVGVSLLYARADHDHGLPANPAPGVATTVTGPDAFGAAAAVGVSLLYARADHDHGLPANPAPSPATTVTGPDAYGAAAVVGTSLLYARADHDHGLPAAPAANISRDVNGVSANVSLPATTTTTVNTTASLSTGTWLIIWACSIIIGATAPSAAISGAIAVGTATATFAPTSNLPGVQPPANSTEELMCMSVATITVAGTINLQVFNGGAAAQNANAREYVAIKLA